MIFKEAPFGNHLRPKKLQSSSTPVEGERPCRDPAFHDTIVITVPMGTTVFLKVVLLFEIDPFSFFSVFLCAIFYPTFVSLFFVIHQ